ncbi:MAG: TonB-dependent receptor, partial [Candidatus Moduliflexus flocculans]|nr:TonB-dependent receptor [Candidatus Moduliflexus flocculans]
GTDDSEYEYNLEGMDYPNWTAALTADYSLGNNGLLSYRAGWHRQNENNQQILPPDGSTYYFPYSNSIYSSEQFYVDNPDLVRAGGYATTWNYFETQKYMTEKISNNLDATFYLSAAGEHSFKAGVGYAYLHEDVFDASTHPRVWLYWGRTYTGLGFPVGRGADPASPYYGQYGYYYVRGSFTSPYGGVWNIHANNWSAYLQDSWTIGGKLTVNVGLRTENQYIPAMTDDTSYVGYNAKPVNFNFGQMLAPRFGVVYDVFGDSSLKVFGSFGIYYDVMKLYMAELTFGGWKRKQDYYSLNTLDWRLDRRQRRPRRRGEPGRRRHLRRHRRLPPALVRPGRSRPQADGPAGDLLRRREEADGEPGPVGPARPEAPHPDDRGRRRLRLGRHDPRAAVLRHQPRLRRLAAGLRGRPVLRRLLALPQGDPRVLRRQRLPREEVRR